MASIKVAVLGEGGVFVREEEIDEAQFDAALHIPASAYGGSTDVAPGKYTWDRAGNCFQPLHNPWEQDYGMLVQHGLALATVHLGEAGPLGDRARALYAIAGKRFSHLVALFAKGN